MRISWWEDDDVNIVILIAGNFHQNQSTFPAKGYFGALSRQGRQTARSRRQAAAPDGAQWSWRVSSERRTVLFLNLGHTLDHLFMLIFPTVVLAMSAEMQRPYAELLPLSLGGFIAFGAFSIPSGWIADHWSRFGMMVVFFIGIGIASILTGLASTPFEIAAGLTLVGAFAAIYHPVGTAMLVANTSQLGRTLGVNGVYGNMGLAFSALIAGAMADTFGWRWAFIVPGVLSVGVGALFAGLRPRSGTVSVAGRAAPQRLPRALFARVFVVLTISIVCNGIIFNAATISMPRVFYERLAALTQSTFGIGALVCGVYAIAAMAQLIVGWLIDRRPVRGVFAVVMGMQVPLLFLAGTMQNYLMLAVALAMMFFVFGQVPINDAMIARYTAEEWRARAYSLRYVMSFSASALSVPLVAYIHRSTGDFGPLFTILAALAFITFAAALAFPGEPQRSPAVAAS
jgi:MFS family permease